MGLTANAGGFQGKSDARKWNETAPFYPTQRAPSRLHRRSDRLLRRFFGELVRRQVNVIRAHVLGHLKNKHVQQGYDLVQVSLLLCRKQEAPSMIVRTYVPLTLVVTRTWQSPSTLIISCEPVA